MASGGIRLPSSTQCETTSGAELPLDSGEPARGVARTKDRKDEDEALVNQLKTTVNGLLETTSAMDAVAIPACENVENLSLAENDGQLGAINEKFGASPPLHEDTILQSSAGLSSDLTCVDDSKNSHESAAPQLNAEDGSVIKQELCSRLVKRLRESNNLPIRVSDAANDKELVPLIQQLRGSSRGSFKWIAFLRDRNDTFEIEFAQTSSFQFFLADRFEKVGARSQLSLVQGAAVVEERSRTPETSSSQLKKQMSSESEEPPTTLTPEHSIGDHSSSTTCQPLRVATLGDFTITLPVPSSLPLTSRIGSVRQLANTVEASKSNVTLAVDTENVATAACEMKQTLSSAPTGGELDAVSSAQEESGASVPLHKDTTGEPSPSQYSVQASEDDSSDVNKRQFSAPCVRSGNAVIIKQDIRSVLVTRLRETNNTPILVQHVARCQELMPLIKELRSLPNTSFKWATYLKSEGIFEIRFAQTPSFQFLLKTEGLDMPFKPQERLVPSELFAKCSAKPSQVSSESAEPKAMAAISVKELEEQLAESVSSFLQKNQGVELLCQVAQVPEIRRITDMVKSVSGSKFKWMPFVERFSTQLETFEVERRRWLCLTRRTNEPQFPRKPSQRNSGDDMLSVTSASATLVNLSFCDTQTTSTDETKSTSVWPWPVSSVASVVHGKGESGSSPSSAPSVPGADLMHPLESTLVGLLCEYLSLSTENQLLARIGAHPPIQAVVKQLRHEQCPTFKWKTFLSKHSDCFEITGLETGGEQRVMLRQKETSTSSPPVSDIKETHIDDGMSKRVFSSSNGASASQERLTATFPLSVDNVRVPVSVSEGIQTSSSGQTCGQSSAVPATKEKPSVAQHVATLQSSAVFAPPKATGTDCSVTEKQIAAIVKQRPETPSSQSTSQVFPKSSETMTTTQNKRSRSNRELEEELASQVSLLLQKKKGPELLGKIAAVPDIRKITKQYKAITGSKFKWMSFLNRFSTQIKFMSEGGQHWLSASCKRKDPHLHCPLREHGTDAKPKVKKSKKTNSTLEERICNLLVRRLQETRNSPILVSDAANDEELMPLIKQLRALPSGYFRWITFLTERKNLFEISCAQTPNFRFRLKEDEVQKKPSAPCKRPVYNQCPGSVKTGEDQQHQPAKTTAPASQMSLQELETHLVKTVCGILKGRERLSKVASTPQIQKVTDKIKAITGSKFKWMPFLKQYSANIQTTNEGGEHWLFVAGKTRESCCHSALQPRGRSRDKKSSTPVHQALKTYSSFLTDLQTPSARESTPTSNGPVYNGPCPENENGGTKHLSSTLALGDAAKKSVSKRRKRRKRRKKVASLT